MSPIQLTSMIKMSLLFASFVSIHADQDEESIVANNLAQEFRTRLHDRFKLNCYITAKDSSDYVWIKIGAKKNATLTGLRDVDKKNATYSVIELVFEDVSREDNGTYLCGHNHGDNADAPLVHVIVVQAPTIEIEFVKPLPMDKIYINWTVHDGHDPVKQYTFLYKLEPSINWVYFTDILYDGRKSSHVLNAVGMKKLAKYSIQMLAKNSIGESSAVYPKMITVLEKDSFPMVSFNETAKHLVTVNWSSAPGSNDLKTDYVYELSEICGDEITEQLFQNLTDYDTSIQLDTRCRYKVQRHQGYRNNWRRKFKKYRSDNEFASKQLRNPFVADARWDIGKYSLLAVFWMTFRTILK